MQSTSERVLDRFLRTAKREFNLSEHHLEGLAESRPVTLYHGTTRLFRSFDLQQSREELVNNYYGKGIFLTPSKRVAEQYAEANRNVGFSPSIIADMKRKNANAGKFLQSLVDHGKDAWYLVAQEEGFWREDPEPGQGTFDSEGLEKYLGADPNTLSDIAGYIVGSKVTPLGTDDGHNLFSTSTGAPEWLYKDLDEVGLNSKVYRPKVYTVSVVVSKPLVTSIKAQARRALSQGYDCVVYHGTDLVAGIPEVAVFDPHKVRIKHIEVV